MLTLPKSKTIGVYTTINGKKELIDISTEVTEIAPALSVPTIIDLINNTTAPRVISLKADVQFRALAKSKPVYAYSNGKLVQDPATLVANDMEIGIRQFSPFEIVEKTILRDIDVQSDPELKNALAKYAVNFISQTRTNLETLGFNQLALAAQSTQAIIIAEKPDASIFSLGAHVQSTRLETAQDVKNAINHAKKTISLIGTQKAKTLYDANNKFVTGINIENDVIMLIAEDIKDKLLELPGLVSSDKGFEMFCNPKLSRILGLTAYSTYALPEGVNFMLITTGVQGAHAHNEVGDGYWASIETKDSWRKDYELQQSVGQYHGVPYEAYVIASFEPDTIITDINKIGNIMRKSDYKLDSESYENNANGSEQEKSTIQKVADALKPNKKVTNPPETETTNPEVK